MQDSQSESASDPSDASTDDPDSPQNSSWLKMTLLLIVGAALAAAGGYAGSLWLLPNQPMEPVSRFAIVTDDGGAVGKTTDAGSRSSAAGSAAGGVSQAVRPPSHQPAAGSGVGPARTIGLVKLFGDKIAERPKTVTELIDRAMKVADCLLRGLPSNPDGLEVVARFNFQRGHLDQASKVWRQAIDADPNYAYAYEGLGKIAARKEETENAINFFRKSLASNPAQFDTQLALAHALIDADKTKEAIELLQQNVEKDPRPYRGRELLGMAYLQMMDYAKAKENYEAAVQALPAFSGAYFGLATACARLGEKDLAKKYLAKFHDLRGKERVFVSRDRIHFDDLEANSIDTAMMYTNAAAVCQAAGYPADAMALCRRAAVLDPNNVGCRQALAWMHLKRGEPDETIRVLEQLAKLQPKNFRYPLEIARLYAQMGRMDDAEQRLIELRDADPKSTVGYVALASLFLRYNVKLNEAAELAQTAVSLEATAANCILLSTICQKTDNLPGAVAAMAKAVELDPKNLQYRQMYELLKTKQTEQRNAPTNEK